MRNANVIEGHGCRQGAWAAFTFCSSFLQLDAAARLNKNGAVAQINATGIGVLESRRMNRHDCGFFFIRRHGSPSYGRAVRGSASCAGSLTRYANLHGSAHPDFHRGKRKLSTAVKEITAMSTIQKPLQGRTSKQAKRQAKTPAEPPATPAMIEGVFAVLHHEGWRPSQRSAFSVAAPTPALDGKVKLPTRAQMDAARTYAEQMGWTPLSPQLADLMRIILRMNYRGRNLVMAVAKAMRREHPWLDDDPRNTNTLE